MNPPKKVLGRGLGALIPQREKTEAAPAPAGPQTGLMYVPIEQIAPNPLQPRKTFNDDSIDELSRSVREHGIIQPLVVTRSGDHKYKLIAGERRYRAAQRAGLATVPIVVKEEMGEGDALQVALIENIQREDLNPIEEALAYHQLHEEFGLTQEEIARRVGKERSTVANFLRLMKLHQPFRVAAGSGAARDSRFVCRQREEAGAARGARREAQPQRPADGDAGGGELPEQDGGEEGRERRLHAGRRREVAKIFTNESRNRSEAPRRGDSHPLRERGRSDPHL